MYRYSSLYDGYGGKNAPLPAEEIDWGMIDLDYKLEGNSIKKTRQHHLVGLTYPDEHGRPVTVLDVDEWGTALLEYGGSYSGCRAEYLEEIKAEMEATMNQARPRKPACPHCNGTGQKILSHTMMCACPHCDGTGKREEAKLPPRPRKEVS